jgi:argininosuccinate synthase
MGLSRDQEIDYAIERGIDIPVSHASPYSVDVNLWGRSIETGILEDPWVAPPADVYAWTADPADTPPPAEITLGFRGGIPVTIDGAEDGPVELVERLNALGGAYGVGRIDHVEDRLVGIKSREIYEAPAAVIVHAAHRALEGLVLAKDQLRFNRLVGQEVAQATYDGLWFSTLQADLRDYVVAAQRLVTGEVRIRLDRGNAVIQGRRSPSSLYDRGLATYDVGDRFDHESAVGFISIFGLPLRTEARRGSAAGAPEPILPTLDVEVADASRNPEAVAG